MGGRTRSTWFKAALVLVATLLLASSGFFIAVHAEENDGLCASCHSQPEMTYVGRAQTTSAVDLASFHAMLAHTKPQATNARCIDCHSGPGLLGRMQSVSLGARDAIKWFSGTAKQPAQQTTPINDANCLKCHADTVASTNFENHFHHALARWQSMDANAAQCVTCHTTHTTDGDAAIGFLQQQRALAECKRCHVALGVDR